ncbi:hypothetical protein [Pseudomonas sp.]|nr:hypothetical protein [Pseudomonas sp.]
MVISVLSKATTAADVDVAFEAVADGLQVADFIHGDGPILGR